MENKEIWPCRFAGDCAHGPECYMTTAPGLRVHGDCECKVLDDGTIAISYQTYGAEKGMFYELVELLAKEKTVTFRQIHYICTNEQPGPVTSTWPLIWNGLVQIDDDKITFEFVERRRHP